GVYIHRQQVKDQRELNRDWREGVSRNHNPCKPITAFQASSIDRLHGILAFCSGTNDSQIALTLKAGALEVFGHSIRSLSQAFSSTTIRATSSLNHSASSLMLTVNR